MARFKRLFSDLRRRHGILIADLSDYTNIPVATISDAETGSTVPPLIAARIFEALVRAVPNPIEWSEIDVVDLVDEDELRAFDTAREEFQTSLIMKAFGTSVTEVGDEQGGAIDKFLNAIPEQDPLVRFGISENAKLTLVPPDAGADDFEAIEALRDDMLREGGPVQTLSKRYETNPNTPQAEVFGPAISGYRDALTGAPLNFTVLYARGIALYKARAIARHQIGSGEWPDFEVTEEAAIETLCELHGPLILASAVGRKSVSDAHEFNTPEEVYVRDRALLEEFGYALATDKDLMEAEGAVDIRALTERGQISQPGRGRRWGIATAGSALVVIVGSAAGAASGIPLVGVLATGVIGKLGWEGLKKSAAGKGVADDIGLLIDTFDDHMREAGKILAASSAAFVTRHRSVLERIAAMRPEFGWAVKLLDNTVPSTESNDASDPEIQEEGEKREFILDIGDFVQVMDGPLEGYSGPVEEIDFDYQRIKVAISSFGRATLVDLSFDQVIKES